MRSNFNISRALYTNIATKLDRMGLLIEDEGTPVNTGRFLIRIYRIASVFDQYYPALISEQDLVEILPEWRCHPRYEAKVLPPKRQPKTSQRVIREHIRVMRVVWRLPIVSFTNKTGEASDPQRAGGTRSFGYRWASSLEDLQDYKSRIRPEIKQNVLAQFERYEAMDCITEEIAGVRDDFYTEIAARMGDIDTKAP